MRRHLIARLAAALLFGLPYTATADASDARIQSLRAEEDWRALCDPAARRDALDAVKCIPLADHDDWALGFGGEMRERFEWTHAPGFGAQERHDDGQWLHRVMAHADLRLGTWRAFAQLKAVFENGRAAGPRPSDEDRLDWHQGFVEKDLARAEGALMFRIGRQELQYGSSRLVSVRESPNVRRTFDAARAVFRSAAWRVDAFVSRPVETRPGVFDDGGEDDFFAGLYAVRAFGDAIALDLYSFALGEDEAEYDRGTGSQRRFSFGSRFSGTRGPIDWDFEGVFQAGRFDGDPIVAWTFASDSGYTLAALPFAPRLGLKADVASGDDGSGALGTFDALYPRGSYFGEAALVGPQNLADVHPSVSMALGDAVTLEVDAVWFWRQRADDGVYNGAGTLVRSSGDADAHFIGSQIGASLEWQPTPRASIGLVYQRFWPGRFLSETGPARDLDFVAAWIQVRL